jgi:hypothetical protein
LALPLKIFQFPSTRSQFMLKSSLLVKVENHDASCLTHHPVRTQSSNNCSSQNALLVHITV